MTRVGGEPSAIVEVWARPGARKEEITWDPWRKRWLVSVEERAQEDEANVAIVELVARALSVGTSKIEWMGGQRSRSKKLRISGLSQNEAMERLRRAAGALPNVP
ncbi:MAG: DUF167 domain-containing protein [Euryarchaeota archaeon]|nr:DUF167 domain-containing protein [Euryarchaeota archaeon]MDE1837486.1 DUF167 domain-containing protein [Euryarchaeota archaeon]MDE1880558.1 DUF167 domain-containing protein [Euryarchaeota archaeon]MDE2045548.1 DUF167 domain-containing protein [Thermoplasmata archaeon]